MLSSKQTPLIFPNAPNVTQPDLELPSTPLAEGSPSDDAVNDLEAQLRAIGEIKPSKIIGDMKPSISDLAKLYQEKKSRIDRFVEWYSNRSLSEKILLGGAVVATSYVVGSFLGIAWLLTGLVTGLYVTAIAIIEEHGKIMRNRDAFTGEGAQKIEALIEEHIKSFQALEGQIDTVFQSLSEQHVKRAEGISVLEDNVDRVGEYNQRYASVVELLENTSKKLLEHQEGVALTESELHALYAEIQRSFERVNEFSLTLSDAVSSVEQAMKGDVAIESTDEQARDASVDATIAQSKQTIDDCHQELKSLRQAANARREAYVAQNKVCVLSSTSCNAQ